MTDLSITTVKLIDDDPDARAACKDMVMDAGYIVKEVDSVYDLSTFVANLDSESEGVVCDYQLTVSTYSRYNGDEILKKLYKNHVAGLLCTRFHNFTPSMRKYRRYIPVVVDPKNLEDKIKDSFLICKNEFLGKFIEERKPWRALVRIEGVKKLLGDDYRLNVIVSGWNPNEGIEIDLSIKEEPILIEIVRIYQEKGICRAKAMVNLGAEKVDDIFLDQWLLS